MGRIIKRVDTNCEFSTIRSNELKCLADDKDVHVCLGTIEKTKCPIYRLKIQLENKIAECEELKDTLSKLTQSVVLPLPEPEVIDLTDCYRRALDEIEREIIAMHYVTILFHQGITHGLADIVQEYKNKILDIISKAKERENE